MRNLDCAIGRVHNKRTMQPSENTIKLLAQRAAAILAKWIGLDGTTKFNNGDSLLVGGMASMFASLVDHQAPPVSAQQRIESAILEMINDRFEDSRKRGYEPNGLYMVFSSDYGPDHDLKVLSEKAGIKDSAWPWKSSLTLTTTYSDGSGSESVRDSRGYRARGVSHRLLPNAEGWLISHGFDVPTPILDVCLAAAKAGHEALIFESIEPKAK